MTQDSHVFGTARRRADFGTFGGDTLTKTSEDAKIPSGAQA